MCRKRTYSERTLQSNVVALNAVYGLLRNSGPAVYELRGDIHGFPLDRDLCCCQYCLLPKFLALESAYIGGGVDVLDRLGDFRSDAVSLNESNRVLALQINKPLLVQRY